MFVGTRQPEGLRSSKVALFREAAGHFARQGIVIRTGGEVGLERLAVEAALAREGSVELFLPDETFGEEWIHRMARKYPGKVTLHVFDPEVHQEWVKCVRQVHPSGKFLSRASTANLASSCGMVLGAEKVVALPFVRHHERGVSGMVLDLARAHGVPFYDLSREEDCEALRAVLQSPESPGAGIG